MSRQSVSSFVVARPFLARLGGRYLALDAAGNVVLVKGAEQASRWKLVEIDSHSGRYEAKDDWVGNWSRTVYTLHATEPALADARLGFRDGKLVLAPKLAGVPMLSATRIVAEKISGG